MNSNVTINADERAARGAQFFSQGYNCAQAVALAFADLYADRVTPEALTLITASFGGGMGRMRLTCGTVSGLAVLAGLENGTLDPTDMAHRTANYALVQKLAGEFKAENDSLICGELLGLRSGQVQPPRPSERTTEYYKARPCGKLVECACRIYARHLLTDK